MADDIPSHVLNLDEAPELERTVGTHGFDDEQIRCGSSRSPRGTGAEAQAACPATGWVYVLA